MTSALLLLSIGAFAGAQETSVLASCPILEVAMDTTKQKAGLKTFEQIVKEISIATNRDINAVRNEQIENKTDELKKFAIIFVVKIKRRIKANSSQRINSAAIYHIFLPFLSPANQRGFQVSTKANSILLRSYTASWSGVAFVNQPGGIYCI